MKRSRFRLTITSLVVILCTTLLMAQSSSPSSAKKGSTQKKTAAKPSVSDAAAGGTSNQPGNETKAPAPKTTSLDVARVDAIDKDVNSITLTNCPADANNHAICNGQAFILSVSDELKSKVKLFNAGDQVRVDYSDKALKSISIVSSQVCAGERLLVLGGAFLLCLLIAALLTRWAPLELIVGEDGRYSNSKTQMAVWFLVVIATYIATVYLRLHRAGWNFFGNISIPQNLLLLSGLSALTFGSAKAITTAKVNAAVAAGGANPKAGGVRSLAANLMQNDAGHFDLGDFQMLVITLLAVSMYLMLIFNFLSTIEAVKTAKLPDVDTTILAAFGLGQGAYLTKKAGGNPGNA